MSVSAECLDSGASVKRGSRSLSPEQRARISTATKAAMDNPEVRERIRTGMRAASGELPEMLALDAAWSAARPAVRKRFLGDVLIEPAIRSPADDSSGGAS
jgi:hypothetical protein